MDALSHLYAAAAQADQLLSLFMAVVVTAAGSYFLGCSNGAVIISKYILRDDVRNHGSGNAGLTNFFRTFGGPLTLAVILIDVFKALLSVCLGAGLFGWLESLLPGSSLPLVVIGKYWAGMFCLLGHMFPCMFGFRGGKGILSGGTIALLLDWRIAVVVWGGFLILTLLTRWVSLGSCWAGASFPLVTFLVYRGTELFGILFPISLFLGGLILWKHRSNLKRIVHGEENRLTFHKKPAK